MVTSSELSTQDKEQAIPLKEKKIENQTLLAKLKYIKENVSVEPTLILFIMPSVLALLAAQNLNLEKACRVNLNFDDTACKALSLRKRENFTHEEDEVQKLVVSIQAWKSIVHTAVPIIFMIFLGAWSDRTGRRKICLLMPIIGEFMTCVLNIVNTYFFYEVTLEWTVFMEVIFPSLTGGWYTMTLGAFSYLGDITSNETRTFRFGVLSLCMTLGFSVGMALSGILLRHIGYYGVFGLSGSFLLLNFIYVFFFIEDHRWVASKTEIAKRGCIGHLNEFFNIKSFRDTLQIVFKKGPNNRRLKICLILSGVCFTFGPVWGELNIMYIFTRYRFNWDELKYSMYATYRLALHALGTMFSISVLSRRYKVDESVLGIISTVSRISGSVVLAFAKNAKEVYVAPVIEALDGSTIICLRSIASQLVSQQELGKVYSLFGLAETLMPLIFAPLYSHVYIQTLHILPGAVFLLTLLFTMPSLIIFVWFYLQYKKKFKQNTLNMETTAIDSEEINFEKEEKMIL